MYTWARGPREDEEADGDQRASEHAGEEMVLELAKGVVVEAREDAVLQVEDLDGEG